MTTQEVTSDWQWAWIDYGNRERKCSWQEVFKDPSSDKFFVVSAVEKYGFKKEDSIYIPSSFIFPYEPKPDFEFGDGVGNNNTVHVTTNEVAIAKVSIEIKKRPGALRTESQLNYSELVISHIDFPMDQYACQGCGYTALDPITKKNLCSYCKRYEWAPWKYAGFKVGDKLTGQLREELIAYLDDNYNDPY